MENEYGRRLGVSHIHRDENQETVGCHGHCELSWPLWPTMVGYQGPLGAIMVGYHGSCWLSGPL